MRIGLMYSTDTNATLAAMGAKQGTGDGRQLQDTVIRYINATGGVAGHPIQASYYNVSATDSPSQISQGACTQWAQDDHVFAAVPLASVQDNDLMRTCLGKAHVLAVYPNFYSETTQQEFGQSPLWFELESLSLEDWAQTYVQGLASEGFFRGTKIGVVYDNGPVFSDVLKRVLLPALKAAGASVVATAGESIHGVNDLGSGSSQMSSAVLNFRTAGVTNVMFFEVWQGWFLFLQNAQSQGWHPTYGLSTQSAPEIMIELGLVPTGELPGSTLVGWNPPVDTGVAGTGHWPREALCHAIYQKAGIDISSGGAEGFHGALAVCEGLLALQDAGRLAATPLTSPGLARGLERLGDRLALANLPSGRFGTTRHYAADVWRTGKYVASCTCYRYSSPTRPMS